VADHGTRNPYDTSLYHEDAPIRGVVEAVRQEMTCGHQIVFCSGRDETFRDVTEAWLSKHVMHLCPDHVWELHMRPAGDTRNDALIKSELFDEYIRDRYNVRRVYDDRDRVIKMWRSLGLTVLQCAEGDF
jgi:hypothetical protein